MNQSSTNGEKESKHLNLRSKIGVIKAVRLEAEKIKHRVARNFEFAKYISTPGAVGKVLQGVITFVTEGARQRGVEGVNTTHSPASRPTVEESTNIDTVCGRHDFARQRLQPVESPVSSMGRRNAKLKTVYSFPNLSEKLDLSENSFTIRKNMGNCLLELFVLLHDFEDPPTRFGTIFRKSVKKATFGKNDIHHKAVFVPVTVSM